MPKPKKKVLIITYYFPPAGGAAVQRTLKFIRFLSSYEWEPIVLTVSNPDYPIVDKQLLSKVPPWLKVYTSYIFEPHRLYMRFTNKKPEQAIDFSVDRSQRIAALPFKERVSDFIRSWCFIPDARVFWTPFAVWRGLTVIKKENIDLIYSSAPPNTVHLVASALRFLTRKKWVADFRDPWTKYLGPQRRDFIPKKLDEFLGERIIRHADRVVCVGKGVKSELEKTAKQAPLRKITVITNGYDEEDYDGLGMKLREEFTVCYIGSLYAKYDFGPFVTAIENIIKQNDDFEDDFRLVFCGRLDTESQAKFEESGFKDNIEFLGNKPHKEAIETMCAATLLLLYVINSVAGKGIPTSKLYEYIGSKRPILALAPEDSEASEIITETGTGVIVPPDQVEAITRAILKLYERWKQGDLHNMLQMKPERKKYEIRRLTLALVNVFDDVNAPGLTQNM
jgi:glycosyltransferase involved in cell wall biosynthesis